MHDDERSRGARSVSRRSLATALAVGLLCAAAFAGGRSKMTATSGDVNNSNGNRIGGFTTSDGGNDFSYDPAGPSPPGPPNSDWTWDPNSDFYNRDNANPAERFEYWITGEHGNEVHHWRKWFYNGLSNPPGWQQTDEGTFTNLHYPPP